MEKKDDKNGRTEMEKKDTTEGMRNKNGKKDKNKRKKTEMGGKETKVAGSGGLEGFQIASLEGLQITGLEGGLLVVGI